MKYATVLKQLNIEAQENDAAPIDRKEPGIFTRVLKFLTRVNTDDFTFEDWQRLEFGNSPGGDYRRDLINHYRGRF